MRTVTGIIKNALHIQKAYSCNMLSFVRPETSLKLDLIAYFKPEHIIENLCRRKLLRTG